MSGKTGREVVVAVVESAAGADPEWFGVGRRSYGRESQAPLRDTRSAISRPPSPRSLGIADELEPDEWKVLQRPPGNLDERAQIEATWRLEGLSVLAWALGPFELPAYDQHVHPQALIRSLGFPDAEASRQLLAALSLRPPAEVEALRKQLLGLHWRLRDYTLRPQAMDFRAFARDCWFGPLDISPFRLIADDLALGDHAINDAPEDVLRSALSAAMERHKAINWLTVGGVYSQTDTST